MLRKSIPSESKLGGDLEGIGIELTSEERHMLLDALMHPAYVMKIQAPATKRFIRDIYKKLKAKLIFDERVHQEIKTNFNLRGE